MDPLRTYDYLTRSRQRVFDWTRPLDAEQYAREFTIGLGTLGRTLTHIMISEWYYVQRMTEREVPPYEQWPIREEEPPAFPILEAAWTELAPDTRTALAAVGDWHAGLEYGVTNDEGRNEIVRATPADLFTQLALHEMHHRAQALNMLRQLGVVIEDLDFNGMMLERRPASP